MKPLATGHLAGFVRLAGLAAVLSGIGASAFAQGGSMHERHGGAGHETMSAVPDLGGEYAFATIAEIAALLRADPDTDWSSVDISALREHLRDMSRVTLDANVVTEPTGRGAVFTVTSDDPDVVASIRRMTADHAATMGEVGNAPPWTYAATVVDGGARIEVEGRDEGDALVVRGLGFHGVMADGDHHQVHHLMLATGASPH